MNRTNWHPWFAWYPITAAGEPFWLETVGRRNINTEDNPVWVYKKMRRKGRFFH